MTAEGQQVWSLATRLGRQLYARGPFGGTGGFDFGAALEMGEALGISRTAVAEFLPVIEAGAIPAILEAQNG
nr:hypothetical protein [Rubellimicrobium aerolatum]